ncbi:MAG: LamG domain-containing protein [Chloroflexi bacterium]|nr:LamG domain-containing protein [Chloroflexota bacterium]
MYLNYELNTWHSALITYDGVEAKLYLDNQLGCTVSFTLEQNDDRDVGVTNYSNGNVFQGTVRNLRIYNEPITPLLILFPPIFVITPVFSP